MNWWPIWIKFFYDFLSNLVVVNHFLLFHSNVLFNFFFLCIISSFVLYTFISIESTLLTLLVLNLILLTFSINTSCFWSLNLCCDFNISLLSFIILYDFPENYLHQLFFFLAGLFYFQVELLLDNVYNLQF